MTKFYLYARRYLTLVFLLGSLAAFAQGRTVTGKVTGADDGQPIPGVNILEKGTANGTVTDADGNFSISVGDNATLVFSFVGYVSQEVAVGSQSSMNVSMQSDVTALSEVVVIGYGEVKKRDATGAVASVKAEDFNRGVIASPEMLIQGRTAGVNVTSASGEPGSGVTIRIRGNSSVRGGNNPLFVVDGIPLAGDEISAGGADIGRGTSTSRNPLNFLNPNDIESIDVLKDASATAIYGSRGANGVVLIKTKSGKGMKKQLDFSSTFNVSQQARYYDLLNASEFLSGVQARGGDPVAQNFQGGDTDWQREVTRSAFSQKYDLGFSNAYDGGTYRISVGYEDQQGVIKESGMERLSARLNWTGSFLDDKLHTSVQGTVSQVDDEYAPITDNAGFEGDLLGGAYMANPTWKKDPEIQPSNTNVNPLSLLAYHQDRSTTKRALVNFSVDYDILKSLNFKVNLGFDRTTSDRDQAYGRKLNIASALNNGRASYGTVDTESDLLEAFFNYKKKFGNSDLNVVAGYSYQQFERSGYNGIGWGFTTDDLSKMGRDLRSSASSIRSVITRGYQGFGYDATDFFITRLFPEPVTLDLTNPVKPVSLVKSVTQDTFAQKDELQSFFGRVNYTIADKYLLTATFRADGSTRFGGNNKYGYFPSAAAAWRLSEESFVPEFFDDLKLRLGYGVTGNQEIPHNLHQARQRWNAPGIANDGNVATPGINNVAFENPDLKWEQTSQLNVGLDFGIIKGKLMGTIDYYNRTTTDLLIQVFSSQPSPQPFTWKNLDGDVLNSGIELTLNYQAIDTEDVGLNFNFNITTNKNEVQNLATIVDTGGINGQGLTGAFSQRIQSGQPLNAYYVRDFVGFDASGFNVYNGDFQQFVGKSPIPKQFMGFTANFRYKNFDAMVFFNGQYGHYIYNNTANAYFTSGSLGNARNVTRDVIATNESAQNAPEVSTRFLEKGDFTRLANFTVGYNIKLNSKAFKRLYAYVGGQNVFVITDYSGLDPEVNTNKNIDGVPSQGIDYTAYPRARTFMLGINASF